MSLGEYMVDQGLIDSAILDVALDLQQTLQGSMHSLLERAGVLAVTPPDALEASAV